MEAKEPLQILGKNGLLGTIESSVFADSGEDLLPLRLEDGEQVMVHRNALIQQEDGRYHLPLSMTELERLGLQRFFPEQKSTESDRDQVVIPVIAEQVEVGKKVVETGIVRVTKSVREREEQIDIPVVREEVTVERVPVNRIVDAPIPTRQEGDTLILSVLKEVLVIEKRLILSEEVHIIRRKIVTNQHERVTTHHEEVAVERLPVPETETHSRRS